MNLKNLISQSIYFSREVHGGKSSEEMFQVLNEKIEKAKEDQPGLSIQFQPFDENHPFADCYRDPTDEKDTPAGEHSIQGDGFPEKVKYRIGLLFMLF